MSMRRRARARREASKANIDMNSLIDLTFLLLVVFIVTLPTLEQTVHIVLPVGKTDSQKDDKKKNISVSIDKDGKLFVGEAPTTHDALKATLEQAVAEDPEVNVLVRATWTPATASSTRSCASRRTATSSISVSSRRRTSAWSSGGQR